MKNNKHVILFALPSFHVGGIERQLLKQLPHFDKQCYEFHLVTFFHNEGKPDLYGKLPDYVHVHRFRFHPGVDLKSTWRVYKFLRTLRPDLVVSSMVFPNTLMRTLKPLVGYKVIAREHNTYTDKRLRHKIRDHLCSFFSDAIVAVSEEVADFASRQALIPRRKFTVIYNGVDLKETEAYKKAHLYARKDILQEFGLSKETNILLNVARIKPQKNHTLLLEAFALFAEKHNEYVLFIVGGGADEAKIRRKVVDLGLDSRIFLTGYRADVYSFYMSADWLILTSDIEGFPNVIVEAMAFGVPVLSTEVSSVNMLIKEGKNGFVIERSRKAICAELESIADNVDDGMYSRMEIECQEVAKQYAILRNVQRYSQLFKQVLG